MFNRVTIKYLKYCGIEMQYGIQLHRLTTDYNAVEIC